jgi:predicted molibdopterin-dependent oxidoreductase YjgC
VAQITGVAVEALYQAAEILAQEHPLAVLYSVGLADPPTTRLTVHNLVNLQLLLGNLEAPGGGVNPLRVQNNSQGASDMGALPDMLPGYQRITDETVQHKFEHAWGRSLPKRAGMSAAAMLAAAGEGAIRALYIIGEDIINTTPAGAQVRRSLEACDFIVLQEILPSETTRYADVLLPGVSFAEKTGTFTSTERRIQMVHQAIDPLGEARPDWQIIAALARRLTGYEVVEEEGKPAPFEGWNYGNTAEIMEEIAALTPIYAGVSHAHLGPGKRVQWPVDAAEHGGTARLPVGYFSDGVRRWLPAEQAPVFQETKQPSSLVKA